MNKVYVVIVDLPDEEQTSDVDSIYLSRESAEKRIVEIQNSNEIDGVYFELRIEEHIVK